VVENSGFLVLDLLQAEITWTQWAIRAMDARCQPLAMFATANMLVPNHSRSGVEGTA